MSRRKRRKVNKKEPKSELEKFREDLVQTLYIPKARKKVSYFLKYEKDEEELLRHFQHRNNKGKIRPLFEKYFESENVHKKSFPLEEIFAFLNDKFYGSETEISRRDEEMKNLKIEGNDLIKLEEMFFSFLGGKFILPAHLVMNILEFMKYNYSLLSGVGCVNFDFYRIVIASWRDLHVHGRNLYKVPLVILKVVKRLSLSLDFGEEDCKYLFTNIQPQKIESFDIVTNERRNWKESVERRNLEYENENKCFLNIMKMMEDLKLTFPACKTITLPADRVFSSYYYYSNNNTEIFRSIQKIKLSKFFPNVKIIENASYLILDGLNELEEASFTLSSYWGFNREEFTQTAVLPKTLKTVTLNIERNFGKVSDLLKGHENLEKLILNNKGRYFHYGGFGGGGGSILDLSFLKDCCPNLKEFSFRFEDEYYSRFSQKSSVLFPLENLEKLKKVILSGCNDEVLWRKMITGDYGLDSLILGGEFGQTGFSASVSRSLVSCFFENIANIREMGFNFYFVRSSQVLYEVEVISEYINEKFNFHFSFFKKEIELTGSTEMKREEDRFCLFILENIRSIIESCASFKIKTNDDLVLVDEMEEMLIEEGFEKKRSGSSDVVTYIKK